MAGGITTSIAYSNGANFTYDAALVSFVGGVASLVLQTSDAFTFVEDVDDDTGFTYDNTKATFTGSRVEQAPQVGATETFRASWLTASLNGTYSSGGGSLTGTPTEPGGGDVVKVTAGKLDLRGNTRKFLDYAGAGNTPASGAITVEFDWTPNYSGAPATDTQFPVSMSQSEGSVNNHVAMQHDATSGNIRMVIHSSTGTNHTSILGSFSPTAGVTYRISINVSSGASRLFIDGVQQGATNTATFTRTNIGIIRIGNSATVVGGGLSFEADCQIDNLRIFSTIQRTTNYTPVAIGTLYAASNVVAPVLAYSPTVSGGTIYSLDSFTEMGQNDPRYTLSIDGVDWYYWNGSNWVVSDETYAQANVDSDIDANIGQFEDDVTVPDPWQNVYLQIHFTDSDLRQQVNTVTVGYTADDAYPTTGPTIVPNSGVEADELCSFIEDATVSGSDIIRWVLRFDSTDYWWNGAAWAVADGTLGQTNTAAEIHANAMSWDISSGGSIRPIARPVSDDGSTTPSLTSVEFEYSFFISDPGAPDECVVYGWVRDSLGEAIAGATVVWSHDGFEHGVSQLFPDSQTVITESDGYWEISIIETATVSLSPYDVRIHRDGCVQQTWESLQVPNLTSASFDVLTGAA